jgi:adenosyl cobinamide kinase/adenosyl cobinamide phosphate guanylyltransferase
VADARGANGLIVLVVGGTRSGKSELAERVAARLGEPVTVVAPAIVGDDPDLAARVAAHRARRPPSWSTVECGHELVDAVTGVDGTLLVDSLGTWVAGADDLLVDTGALVDALAGRAADTVVVTEEVGLAVHAPTVAGRRFTDVLGELNTAVAAVADRALFVVAGLAVTLDPPDRALDGP